MQELVMPSHRIGPQPWQECTSASNLWGTPCTLANNNSATARNAKVEKSKKQGSPAFTELLLDLPHGLLVLLIQQPVPPDSHCKCLVNQVIHNVLNVAGEAVLVALMGAEACLVESSACSICKRFLA